jgi:hypothetical protein
MHKRYGNRLYPITASTSGTYIHQHHDKPLEADEFTPRTFQQGLKRPGRWKEYTLKKGETEKTKRIKFGLFVEGKRKGECIPIKLTEPPAKKRVARAGREQAPSPAQNLAEKEKERKRQEEIKVKEVVNCRVIDAIADSIKSPMPSTPLLREIARSHSNQCYDDSKYIKFFRTGTKVETLSPLECVRLIAINDLCDDIDWEHKKPGNFMASMIKHYKIDTAAIEKKVREELTPKKAEAASTPLKSRTSGTRRGKRK